MKKQFNFIDLFAGIGGIRIPFEELGGKCVFTSEWDKFSQITYEANCAPKIYLTKTHEKTLELVPLKILREYALDIN